MSKKIVPFIDPKKPVCKWDACASEANVKGFCRLHFLKSLKLKRTDEEIALEKEAIAKMRRDRRKSNRLVGVEDPESGDAADVQNRVNSIDNIDLDMDVLLEGDIGSRKTGTGE